MKSISLFACGGIGDLGLRHAGFDVIVANELIAERAEVFKYNFPDSHMIVGDIWEKQDEILSETKRRLGTEELDLVFATPGGLKEQVQQSVNFSEHANHETGHSRLRNIVTTWRLNEPSLPD